MNRFLSYFNRKIMTMKVPLFLCLFLAFSFNLLAQNESVIQLSEPVSENSEFAVFGSEMEESAESKSISLSDLVELENIEEEVYLKTSIKSVCKKKGCFFIATDGDLSARVTFKDYSFFIPTNSAGKDVIVRGMFNIKELTEDQAKHYAEDAGEDASEIKGSQKEYSLIATSIKIPK